MSSTFVWMAKTLLLECIVYPEYPECLIQNVTLNASHRWPDQMREYPIILLRNVLVDLPSENLLDLLTNKTQAVKITQSRIPVIRLTKHLKFLEMSNTHTEMLAIDETSAYDLITLIVEGNDFFQFPRRINKLSQLRVLKISRCPIDNVEMDQLNGLDALEELIITETGTKRVTATAAIDLPSLWKVNLYANHYDTLDMTNWMFPKLREIEFGNHLMTIPTSLPRFTNLTAIYLAYNRLQSLTMTEFVGMTQLQTLTLGNNRLEHISVPFKMVLPSLEDWRLNENSMLYLNASLLSLPKLRFMSIQNNLLKRIDGIMNWSRLENLMLYDNPFECYWLQELAVVFGHRLLNLYYAVLEKCD